MRSSASLLAPARITTLSLEPLPGETGNTATNPLPDLANYIDAVDADLASTLAAQGCATTSTGRHAFAGGCGRQHAARDRARNAFAAKQQPVADKPLPPAAMAGLGHAGHRRHRALAAMSGIS